MAITRTTRSITAHGINRDNIVDTCRTIAQDIAGATGFTLVEQSVTSTGYSARLLMDPADTIFIRVSGSYTSGISSSSVSMSLSGYRLTSADQETYLSGVSQVALFSRSPTSDTVVIRYQIINIDDKYYTFVTDRGEHISIGAIEDSNGVLRTTLKKNQYSNVSYSRMAAAGGTVYDTTTCFHFNGGEYYSEDASYNFYTFSLMPEATSQPAVSYDKVYMMPYKLYCPGLNLYAKPAGKTIYLPTVYSAPGLPTVAFFNSLLTQYMIGTNSYQPLDSVQAVANQS